MGIHHITLSHPFLVGRGTIFHQDPLHDHYIRHLNSSPPTRPCITSRKGILTPITFVTANLLYPSRTKIPRLHLPQCPMAAMVIEVGGPSFRITSCRILRRCRCRIGRPHRRLCQCLHLRCHLLDRLRSSRLRLGRERRLCLERAVVGEGRALDRKSLRVIRVEVCCTPSLIDSFV